MCCSRSSHHPGVKERSLCLCPSVVPNGKSTYLGLCRGKNLALCVSAEFGFSSASAQHPGWKMMWGGCWGWAMAASALGHARGRNVMQRERNGHLWLCQVKIGQSQGRSCSATFRETRLLWQAESLQEGGDKFICESSDFIGVIWRIILSLWHKPFMMENSFNCLVVRTVNVFLNLSF